MAHNKKSRESEGQFSLFSFDEDDSYTDNFPEMEELTKQELLQFEKEYLGFYLTQNPLTAFLPLLEKKVTHKIHELTPSNSPVIIGGMVTQVRKIITKNGGLEMAFVRLNDFTGTVELVVFPKLFERTRDFWHNDRIIILKGKTNERDDRISVIVDDAKALDL